jgi:hypothetical protein
MSGVARVIVVPQLFPFKDGSQLFPLKDSSLLTERAPVDPERKKLSESRF